jgi:hypothetical protein
MQACWQRAAALAAWRPGFPTSLARRPPPQAGKGSVGAKCLT